MAKTLVIGASGLVGSEATVVVPSGRVGLVQ